MTILLAVGFNILWYFKFKNSYMRGIKFKDFTSSVLIYGYNFACILAWIAGISL